MSNNKSFANGIPISVSLADNLNEENFLRRAADKTRLVRISIYAILIAVCVSIIAKLLVFLINLVTNLFFFGQFSFVNHSPAANSLGWFVIAIPVIGGVLVGLMALFGSRAIRGHGIPRAHEMAPTPPRPKLHLL